MMSIMYIAGGPAILFTIAHYLRFSLIHDLPDCPGSHPHFSLSGTVLKLGLMHRRLGRRSAPMLAAKNVPTLFTFEQFPSWLPPMISANQPAFASLGGSHGKLRRVDAKAT